MAPERDDSVGGLAIGKPGGGQHAQPVARVVPERLLRGGEER